MTLRNVLAFETSPYLLQHKDNPVAWQPWSGAAFAAARETARPILLSVGYAACHWCHVMAHESFEDPKIAALMNELFVSIKVDREERPDIDVIYQHALALLGQQGGWPLTMFLTPEGEPFWGGTYFPPAPRWGRPGFAEVLRQIHAVYHGAPERIAQNRAALQSGLAALGAPRGTAPVAAFTPTVLDQVAEAVLSHVDMVHGGLSGAPKFPQCSLFQFLWQAWFRTGRPAYRAAVLNTLDRMCQGGIYDHLGGGFARYSTDERWLVPHFEKMLYDNAQILELLVAAWRETAAQLYRQRAAETVAWVLREMTTREGAFASSQDADSEGREGAFYVWTEAEIDALIGRRAAAFKDAYGVTAAGNWEGQTILNRSDRSGLDAAGEAELAEARALLLAARERRPKPGWDDKVLADWNGLAIAALAGAAVAFGEPGWLAAAERAFAFIVAALGEGDRLRHSFRDGRAKHAGLLEDYGAMARAALALYEATGAPTYLDNAARWVRVCDSRFWDAAHGGYFQTPDDGDQLIVRVRHAADNATPAGNGLMLGVLARLHLLTGEPAYRTRAMALAAGFLGELDGHFIGLATLMNNVEVLNRPIQIAIVAGNAAADTVALLAAAHNASLPYRSVHVLDPDSALPDWHPGAGKRAVAGRATAYVCVGMTCSLPVTGPTELLAALPRPPAGD
ncbi:MAG: thioredoxin domain-containing protein [Alphaproteobacteria bacterium]|nr:thioredoxin domain-containing protein [Alphaproteobacteria bacterium]